MKWATSKDYIKLVGESEGWVAAPPGTRKSTYDNPKYQEAAPFAEIVYKSIANADITKPTKDPVPYIGIQYVAIPEFQGDRHPGRPADRRGARRAGDGRAGAARPRSVDRAHDAPGRLPEVSRPSNRTATRRRAVAPAGGRIAS